MKKNMENNEARWVSFKRRLEKYMADPGSCGDTARIEEEGRKYQGYYQELIRHVHEYAAEKSAHDETGSPRFRFWFQRQDARNKFQSSILRHMQGLYYVPVAYELSDGCSIGCDFCCLAAKPLKSVYRYTGEHSREWRQILGVTREIIGDFAGAGVCYFATEPFDNPDYEKFLEDFRDILGYMPQTTTAAAERNVERTRAFLAMLGEEELAHAAVRFSVTSLEQLDKIYEAFSAEELAYVELLLNNPESISIYSKSGRSIELSETMDEKRFLDTNRYTYRNGFVVNMPGHTVMLITVQRPDERYPLGMEVIEKKTFSGPEDYRRVLLEMIERWMPEEMPLDMPMELAEHITCEPSGFRLKIQGDKISRTVTMGEAEKKGFWMLLREQKPINEILTLVTMTEYEKNRFLKNAELFYRSGYMEERRKRYGLE